MIGKEPREGADRIPEEVRKKMDQAERLKIAEHRGREFEDSYAIEKQRRREAEALSRENESLARIDPLTNLLNRRGLMEEASRLMSELVREGMHKRERSLTHLTLALIDLDRFKELNDKHGHLLGDAVLKRVGEILREQVRASDVLARYGGEEFALLFPGASVSNIIRKLQEIPTIEIPDPKDPEKKIFITFTAGVTELNEGDKTVEEAIGRADLALYAGKTSGRNKVLEYDDSMKKLERRKAKDDAADAARD